MIPAWVMTTIVVFLSCIAAIWVGSTLSGYEPYLALEIIFLALACVLCAASNNFPLLLAVGTWTPFSPPMPGYRAFPAVGTVVIWIVLVLFFRMALSGTTTYRRSFSWILLLIFAWVPIRFFMNPIKHLGAGSGGSGVSGAAPYFGYALAAGLLVSFGLILTDREKVVQYFRWCFVIVLFVGTGLLICAFIPSTGPFLTAMGSFAAGNLGDNIQRIVQLPSYGLFLMQASLCPILFRLKWWQCSILFVLGFAMIVVGGNRSALAVVPIVILVVLFLRRRSTALIFSLAALAMSFVALQVTISNMDEADIPPLMRSFGVFNQEIEQVSGGDLSAKWRYDIWQSGIEKIKESPLTGKGFGNLPEHLSGDTGVASTDYETILAGGLAHNGFISAAYGFGIPFAVGLSLVIVWLFFKESILALRTDKHDPVLRELHALLACMFAAFPVFIYAAFDLSTSQLWEYVAISYILSRSPKAKIYPASPAGDPLRKYGGEAGASAVYSSRPY